MSQPDYRGLRIGVLAIQGAFARHLEVCARLGAESVEVRNADQLEGLDGLILPGGESTTMYKVIDAEGWLRDLEVFGQSKPVMGTCAGMILMGTELDDVRLKPFGWMPIRVVRNAYGSQVNSFRDVGEVTGFPGHPDMEMVFIRAPKFESLSGDVEILGTCRGEPVLARYGHHLALSFHPELTDDDRVHRYWLDTVVRQSMNSKALDTTPMKQDTVRHE